MSTSTNDQDAPGSKYLFSDVETDAYRVRLENQHRWVTTYISDGRLIYAQTVKLKAGSCVLDAATGTGIWLLQLGVESPPGVFFYGIDVSDKHFPLLYPSTHTFLQGSITSLPKDFDGKFDVINQKLLRVALQASDWTAVVPEYFRALKLGGYVQFIEHAFNRITPGEASVKHEGLFRKLAEATGLLWDCSERLPKMLEDAGFVDVRFEEKWAPGTAEYGEDGIAVRETQLLAWKSWGPSIMKHGGLGVVNSVEEYEELLAQVLKEQDEGGMRFALNIVCARKPT